jgi:hypothetical protein
MRSVGHVSGWILTAKRAEAAKRKHQVLAGARGARCGASKKGLSECVSSLMGKDNKR